MLTARVKNHAKLMDNENEIKKKTRNYLKQQQRKFTNWHICEGHYEQNMINN